LYRVKVGRLDCIESKSVLAKNDNIVLGTKGGGEERRARGFW